MKDVLKTDSAVPIKQAYTWDDLSSLYNALHPIVLLRHNDWCYYYHHCHFI